MMGSKKITIPFRTGVVVSLLGKKMFFCRQRIDEKYKSNLEQTFQTLF